MRHCVKNILKSLPEINKRKNTRYNNPWSETTASLTFIHARGGILNTVEIVYDVEYI